MPLIFRNTGILEYRKNGILEKWNMEYWNDESSMLGGRDGMRKWVYRKMKY